MTVLLKKLQNVANDFRPVFRSKASPRIVTLAIPAHKQSRLFWAAIIVACLFISTLSIAVLWLTHKPGLPAPTSFIAAPKNSKITVTVEPETKASTVPEPATESDIALPADSLSPEATVPENPPIIIGTKEPSALPAVARAISINPQADSMPSADQILQDAHAALESGDAHTALMLYNRALEDNKNSHTALTGKIYALQRLGQYENAIITAHHLLQYVPDDDVVRNGLTISLGQSNSPDAVTELRRIIASDSGNAAAHASLARQLARQNNLDEAFTHLSRAVALTPGNLVYKFDLAILYDQAGHSAEAIDIYEKVLRAVVNSDEPRQLPFSVANIRQRLNYLNAKMASAEFNENPQ